jgi:hypothetical protein
MWRQTIGVMQYRGHRQIFTTDWAIDNDLQTFDGTKRVNCAPISARAIMISDKHQIISCALAARAILSSFF